MFESAKLKVQWANRHINHLNEVINVHLGTDFYTFVNELDAATGTYGISVKSNGKSPAAIYLLLGDAIHNLRSALDHAATEVVGKGDHIYFPFHEERISLVNSEGEIVCSKTKLVEAAVPNLGNYIIDEIKPYRAGNPFLWPLTKLDAIDKHKFLVPAITPTTVIAHDLYDCQSRISVGQAQGVVGPGGIAHLIQSTGKFEVRGKIQAIFEVLFTEATFFEGKPVIETLANISNAVSEALRGIEKFVTSAKETSV